MPEYQFQAPTHLPNAAVKAALIQTLLSEPNPTIAEGALDLDFFAVLADFEAQARRLGLSDTENPFRRISDQAVQFLQNNIKHCLTATDVPTEFAQAVGRFRHILKEAAYNPSLVPIAIRTLLAVLPRIADSGQLAFQAQMLTELGEAYSSLLVTDRAKAVQTAIGYLQQALALRPLTRYPFEHAETQYQLGNAYLRLPASGAVWQKNLQLAQTAFSIALQIAQTAPAVANRALIGIGLATAQGLQADGWQAAQVTFATALELLSADEYPQNRAFAYQRLAAVAAQQQYSAAALQSWQEYLNLRADTLSPVERAASLLQQALCYLQLPDQPAADQHAAECLRDLLQILANQQHPSASLQFAFACGPAFVRYQTPSAVAQLAAQVSRLEMRDDSPSLRELACTCLRLAVAQPANAEAHITHAFASALAACPTCR